MSVDLTKELGREHLPYELIAHLRTESAGAEAAALGVSPEEVAKTVVLTDEGGFVRTVLPASKRLDLRKVHELLERKALRLATEAELVLAYPMFELGAVPPVGGPCGDGIVVDRRLAAEEHVLLEAGTHTKSVRLRTSDLLKLAGAYVADICRS